MPTPITAYSRFRIPATLFSPTYTVGGAVAVDPAQYAYFGLSRNARVQSSSLQPLNTLLLLDATRLQTETASDIAADHEAFVSRLALSQDSLTTLLAEDRFMILNGRLGIQVTTDNGAIDTVSLTPRTKDSRSGIAVTGPEALANSAEITTRAASVQGNTLPAQTPPASPEPSPGGFRQGVLPGTSSVPTPPRPSAPPIGFPKRLPTLPRPGGLGNTPPLAPALPPKPIEQTFVENLNRLQPPPLETTRVGTQGSIAPGEAGPVGAFQAGLGIPHSPGMQQGLLQLREAAALMARQIQGQRLAKAREASMPVVPGMPFVDTIAFPRPPAETSAMSPVQSGTALQPEQHATGGGGSLNAFLQNNGAPHAYPMESPEEPPPRRSGLRAMA